MAITSIRNNRIKIILTSPRSKVRICDKNGDHISKPAAEGIYNKNYFIEWMITNNELSKLIKHYSSTNGRKILVHDLIHIKHFLKKSIYHTRKPSRRIIGIKYIGFNVYKISERYYSFERSITKKVTGKLTFKMGDYTLAVFMFILIPFTNKALEVFNANGKIKKGEHLGSGAFVYWRPTKQQVRNIAICLAHASKQHRNDIIDLIKSIR